MSASRRAILSAMLAAALIMSAKGAMTMESESKAVSVQELMRRLQKYRFEIPGVPREAALGYPVPVVSRGGLFLAAPIYLRHGLPPNPPQLSAPGWIAYADVATGTQFSYRKLDTDLSVTLGPHRIDPPLDMAQFDAAEARMYQAMDRLLPLAESKEPGVPREYQAEAKVFVDLWRQLAHRPLADEYRAINPAWFARFGL
jgi:hypothetical protein